MNNFFTFPFVTVNWLIDSIPKRMDRGVYLKYWLLLTFNSITHNNNGCFFACFTTPLVRTTSSPIVIRKLLSRFSCLLPHLWMHLFKVWKMLILLVETSLWGRGKNSTFATHGDLSTDGTYGKMPTPGYLWGPCFTTPLVRTTSLLTVSRKLHNRLSCLMHPFKVWKMLILLKLVGTSLWGRW